MRNHTVTTFILLGLTDDPQLKIVIFIFLFLTYMLSVTGNLTIISLTFIDSHLKTAMYFFLQNFSFLEISFTSACIPRYLYNISTGDKTIAYNNCISQIFFADLFGVTEFFLLATMSYDRYVAICKPLHYMTIMNNMVCRRLILCCWMAGLLIIIPPLSLGLHLEFCDSNVIDHFFCDAVPLLKIMLRNVAYRANDHSLCSVDLYHDPPVCYSVVCIHHQDHFTIPFCPAKEKGIFHMFFPFDCGLHHLWKLYFHLC